MLRLLHLLLIHVAEAAKLTVGVVIERGLLWLNSVLRLQVLLLLLLGAKLIEACRLLLLEAAVAAVAVLKARLLRLHTGRLSVRIVEETSVLRLLLALVHEVAKPVYLTLLLISLVVTRRLVGVWLRSGLAK